MIAKQIDATSFAIFQNKNIYCIIDIFFQRSTLKTQIFVIKVLHSVDFIQRTVGPDQWLILYKLHDTDFKFKSIFALKTYTGLICIWLYVMSMLFESYDLFYA